AFAQAEDGLAVFVHGDLDVAVTRSGEDELVSGRHVATWVDRIVDEPIDFVAVAAEGAGTRELDERLDLRAGIVPAGSLLLSAAPPLGLLLFDDGTTFSLDGEVVVGREPDGDPRVASGDAQPLVVTDTERSVSRLHLRIVLQGGAVELIDLRSANGTAIRRPRDSA